MKFQRCAEQLLATIDELSAALKVQATLKKELADSNSAHGQVVKNLQVDIIQQYVLWTS